MIFLVKSLILDHITINNQELSTILLNKPSEPFMIIDSLSKENNTYNGVYLIYMGSKNLFKVGRSNQNDIIIKDISVSRNHAVIRFENNCKFFNFFYQKISDYNYI